MKTRRFLFAISVAFLLTNYSSAQDCSFYSLSKGSITAYQSFDAKSKLTGTTRTTCMDVSLVNSVKKFTLKSEFADAKNENQSSREYEMRCENGMFYVDMRNFIDPKSMAGFKDMELSVDANDMMYPSGLSAGQVLPDANITLGASSGGVNIMNIIINVTNRQVLGKETVTVPAGTFECYKITYDVESKMMFKVYTTVTEYVNIGIGSIKSETYDKKGKLLGSTILSELKR